MDFYDSLQDFQQIVKCCDLINRSVSLVNLQLDLQFVKKRRWALYM